MAEAEQRQGIYICRSGPARTIVIGAACPQSMLRPGVWRVDDYELHKQLYKGKASILYSATCKKSGKHVALKLYRKPRLSDLNWFQVNREIQLHSALKHENIIDFYAAFEDVDNVYMVQEYAHGGDLYGELKRCGGRFKDKNVARDILLPCMLALQYCHSKGVIHRDIKPENILLTQHKIIKLADFGLSINANAERPVTRAGTLDYMAPEVLTCPEKSRPEENKDKLIFVYNHAVDAWAMGILAFECLSGKPPFERSTRTETYEHIMYKKHVCPSYFTKESADFIHHALSKVASKRAAMADLLIHPWIAQYRTQKDAKIGAYHGVEQPVPAVQKQAPRVPSSVLDAAAVLSCTGSEQGDAQVALAETIRQGGPQRTPPLNLATAASGPLPSPAPSPMQIDVTPPADSSPSSRPLSSPWGKNPSPWASDSAGHAGLPLAVDVSLSNGTDSDGPPGAPAPTPAWPLTHQGFKGGLESTSQEGSPLPLGAAGKHSLLPGARTAVHEADAHHQQH